MSHVWIVEMLDKDKWVPATECSLSHADGKESLASWKLYNPDDKFRLVKYVPEGKK